MTALVTREEMERVMAERDRFRELNAELVAALGGLIDEYVDRKCQFGEDYLWEKHEDPEVIERALITFEKAKEEPHEQA